MCCFARTCSRPTSSQGQLGGEGSAQVICCEMAWMLPSVCSGVPMVWLQSRLCGRAGGRRLLRQWMCRPLRDIAAINGRLDAVQELVTRQELVVPLRAALQGEHFLI